MTYFVFNVFKKMLLLLKASKLLMTIVENYTK